MTKQSYWCQATKSCNIYKKARARGKQLLIGRWVHLDCSQYSRRHDLSSEIILTDKSFSSKSTYERKLAKKCPQKLFYFSVSYCFYTLLRACMKSSRLTVNYIFTVYTDCIAKTILVCIFFWLQLLQVIIIIITISYKNLLYK